MPTVCPKHGVERDKWKHCPQCRKEYLTTEHSKILVRRQRTSEKTKALRRTPKHKLHNNARKAVQRAIQNGKLNRQPCVVCGDSNAEAHHYLGYSKEHRLDVVFLCRTHHRQADRNSEFNEKIKSMAPSSSRLG